MNAPAMPRIVDDRANDRSSLAGRLVVLGTQMLKLAGELSRRETAGEASDLPADSALLGAFRHRPVEWSKRQP